MPKAFLVSVVEDDRFFRDSMRRLMKSLGHSVEAFYTTKSSGVGMGLSICRSIIDAHGGRLWADANKPRGAVFQFTLPARRGNSAPSYKV